MSVGMLFNFNYFIGQKIYTSLVDVRFGISKVSEQNDKTRDAR